MDSSVKHFAEKTLSDEGFFLDDDVDGIYWRNRDDPNMVPLSLRDKRFSLFDDALETLCSALMPYRIRDVEPKTYVVKGNFDLPTVSVTAPTGPFKHSEL